MRWKGRDLKKIPKHFVADEIKQSSGGDPKRVPIIRVGRILLLQVGKLIDGRDLRCIDSPFYKGESLLSGHRS